MLLSDGLLAFEVAATTTAQSSGRPVVLGAFCAPLRRRMHRCDAICGWTRSFWGSGFWTHLNRPNLHSLCVKHMLQTPKPGQELAREQLGSAIREQQRRAKLARRAQRRAASAPGGRLRLPRRARRVRKGCVLLGSGATSQPLQAPGSKGCPGPWPTSRKHHQESPRPT